MHVKKGAAGVSRRGALGLGLGAAAALGTAGCGTVLQEGPGGSGGSGDDRPSAKPSPTATAKPIGAGSTSFTGKQPHQPAKPVPLEAGQTPPQFVIFSWDGAGEVGNGLFPRFLELARTHGAHMTFFLSGLYLLPESQKRKYLPPNNAPGASDIGYLTDEHVKATLTNVRMDAGEAALKHIAREKEKGEDVRGVRIFPDGLCVLGATGYHGVVPSRV